MVMIGRLSMILLLMMIMMMVMMKMQSEKCAYKTHFFFSLRRALYSLDTGSRIMIIFLEDGVDKG